MKTGMVMAMVLALASCTRKPVPPQTKETTQVSPIASTLILKVEGMQRGEGGKT